tara:strand:+ start:532 stop:894 length:363 start_codon:yes stop_codon:yes gene_type:complete
MNITQTKRADSYSVEFSVEENGKNIGFVFLVVIQNNADKGPYGLLENLYIDSGYRRQGYGSALITAVIAHARDIGCYKLIAQSRHGREGLHAMYRKYGFADHGVNFRMNLTDSSFTQQKD